MPDSSTETWGYGGNGDLTGYTNQLGQTIGYVFDDSDRLVTIDYPTSTDTNFSYDNANRRTQMTDATGSTLWSYDAAAQITGLQSPIGTTSYTYQSSGRRATMTESGVGITSYGYDAAGHTTSVQNSFGETTTYVFDDGGRTTRRTIASGAYTI
jgi:YD repeat-containing protein